MSVTPRNAGALFGVGLGPGDPELVTMKAARVIGATSVVAYFAKQGRESHARKIAARYLRAGCEELLLAYPMTTERPFDQPEYVAALADSMKRARSVSRKFFRAGWTSPCSAREIRFFMGPSCIFSCD